MKKVTQPDLDRLKRRPNIKLPLIGFYDAPEPALFEPLVSPEGRDCVYSFFKTWLNGKTLHITRARYGCGGAGHWMWGLAVRSRKDFLKFLVDEEGLKASRRLMEKWVNLRELYKANYSHLFIGPLKEEAWPFAKTITFLVNPDQLSALTIGAQYHSSPDDPAPVLAPFGSGCSQLQPFKDLSVAQASIGATDIAMRHHLPPDIFGFTVTGSTFQRLCSLDERSFPDKPFLKHLKLVRGGTL